MTTELEELLTLRPQSTVLDESFYLDRFKRAVTNGNWTNGRVVDSDYYCELYKGFAVVVWKREIKYPNNLTRERYDSYVWEIGTYLDNLQHLAWVSQGVVTTTWNSDTQDKALKKTRKKLDTLALAYSIKGELRALALTHRLRITSNDSFVFNATVGDVVAIRAFGRARLGKIVKTTGNRFVVAYMTPSNANDVHYKTLPLQHLYPKEVTP